MKIKITKRYYLYLFIAGFVSNFFHELGHVAGAKLVGIDVVLSINKVQFLWENIPKTDFRLMLVFVGGPLFTLLLCYLSLFALKNTKKHREVLVAFVLFNIRPLYIFIALLYTKIYTFDEFKLFSYCGWNTLWLYLVYTMLYAVPLAYTIKNTKPKDKIEFFILSVFIIAVIFKVLSFIDRLVLE